MTMLYSLASTTLILTPVIVVLLLVMPFLDKKFAANGRYLLWVIVMVALMLPFATVVRRPRLEINVPIVTQSTVEVAPPAVNEVPSGGVTHNMPFVVEPPEVPTEQVQNNAVSEIHVTDSVIMDGVNDGVFAFDAEVVDASPVLNLPDARLVILLVWLAGAAVFAVAQGSKYFSFRRFVKRWGEEEVSPEVLELLRYEMEALGIRKHIRVCRLKGINAPMLVGIFSPVILLNHGLYGAEDLSFVFRHELIHYKRRDLWYKLALLAIRAVYWFNPAVHLMAKQANKDIEIICDMLTVRGMDIDSRKRYSELILSLAGGTALYKGGLATCMNGGKKMLKERFANILGGGKKKGIAVFVMLGVMIAVTSFTIGVNFAAAGPEHDYAAAGSESDYDYPSFTWQNAFDTALGTTVSERLLRTRLAMEAEIERLLMNIYGITRARVMVYLSDSWIGRVGEYPTAAFVVLETSRDFTSEEGYVLAEVITRAVNGLEMENVHIMNNHAQVIFGRELPELTRDFPMGFDGGIPFDSEIWRGEMEGPAGGFAPGLDWEFPAVPGYSMAPPQSSGGRLPWPEGIFAATGDPRIVDTPYGQAIRLASGISNFPTLPEGNTYRVAFQLRMRAALEDRTAILHINESNDGLIKGELEPIEPPYMGHSDNWRWYTVTFEFYAPEPIRTLDLVVQNISQNLTDAGMTVAVELVIATMLVIEGELHPDEWEEMRNLIVERLQSEERERLVGYAGRSSFGTLTSGIPAGVNANLAIGLIRSNVHIGYHDGMIQGFQGQSISSPDSIHLISYPMGYHSAYTSPGFYMVFNNANTLGNSRNDTLITANIPRGVMFESLDIYVETGDVTIEDVTITGRLDITVGYGEITLTNVRMDNLANIYINGERFLPPTDHGTPWDYNMLDGMVSFRMRLS